MRMKIVLLLIAILPSFLEASTIRVGSKNFPESYILGEIIGQVLESDEAVVLDKKLGLGGSGIVYKALLEGDIDLYAEYTGTLSQVLLKNPDLQDIESLNRALNKLGLIITEPLGFNNTYALAVRKKTAQKYKLTTISDLSRHSDLKAGFSYEFMKREDAYPALAKRYNLVLKSVKQMEHSLTYQAIKNKKLDVIDVYTTDAKLEKLDLVLLRDDKNFFPSYYGVILARLDFVEKNPHLWEALKDLENRIGNDMMIHLNSLADLEKKTFAEVADIFLGSLYWTKLEERKNSAKTPPPRLDSHRYKFKGESYRTQIWRLTKEHLFLVFVSLFAAILIGLPLGILAHSWPRLGQSFLIGSGIIQTIPSLALLCFLIPLFGIGTTPALIALFLYSLFPIVRNTHTGLKSLDPKLIETSLALGLSGFQRLFRIQIPLASIHILGGIKMSAIINVGTATLAALIGAGGYGTLIVTGLSLNDVVIILKGALPAAALAFVIHILFETMDEFLIPLGLRR